MKDCAFYEESTILTECADFDTSMNIKYGGICEINANSKKFGIFYYKSILLLETGSYRLVENNCSWFSVLNYVLPSVNC